MNSENNLIEKINKILSVSLIVCSSVGIASNLVSIFICLRKDLRKLPTFVFLTFLSSVNILKLLSIPLSVFTLQYLVSNIQKIDKRILNICIFMIFWEYQSTAYLKIVMIVDQLMCIEFTLWRRSLFNSTKAILLSLLLVFSFILSNIHLNFKVRYENAIENVTSNIEYLISSEILINTIHVRYLKLITIHFLNFIIISRLISSYFC